MAEVKRAVRVAARLHAELAGALGALRDPRLAHATITRVELTDDLLGARVFVRIAWRDDAPGGPSPGGDPTARRRLLDGLHVAAPRLRREVGRALGLRRSPELRFLYDEGMEASERVEQLLREVSRDARGPED